MRAVGRVPRSARAAGILLLAVPVTTALAMTYFPSYDARPQYFASYYGNIVGAGDGYIVALILFLLVAAILASLALALSRSPLGRDASALMAVTGGLAVSAAGFAAAAVAGSPVWAWARQAADGSQPISDMVARSAGLASFSQTVLLMFGLGGLLVAMSVLGFVAMVRRWTPKLLFVGTVAAAVAVVLVSAVTSGPVFWLAFAALPMFWALAFGASLFIRGQWMAAQPSRASSLAAGRSRSI